MAKTVRPSKASNKARPKAKKKTRPERKTPPKASAPVQRPPFPYEDTRGPVLAIYYTPIPPAPPPDPALLTLSMVDRFAMLARAAIGLGLSGFDRLSMLAAEYATYYRIDAEAEDAADALTLGRILKATCLAMATDDRTWLEEQAKRAKAYLDRNKDTYAEEPLVAHGGDIAETRPAAARRLRYLMLQRLEDGANESHATQLADLLMSFLFVSCRQSSMPIVVDIPNAPRVDTIQEAGRVALAGKPRSAAARDPAGWARQRREHAAFVDEVRRRDPWAFWPESMRPRCEDVRRKMLRVLLDRAPGTPLERTAEDLVRAGLRGLRYPEEKVRSLFASADMN